MKPVQRPGHPGWTQEALILLSKHLSEPERTDIRIPPYASGDECLRFRTQLPVPSCMLSGTQGLFAPFASLLEVPIVLRSAERNVGDFLEEIHHGQWRFLNPL